MSTITKEFTKEQLIEFATAILDVEKAMTANNLSGREARASAAIAEIALASLEAQPVAWLLSGGGAKNNVSFDSGNAYADPLREVTPLYTAPPAPVSMKDHQIRELVNELRDISVEYHGTQQLRERIARTVRAAMLQGADTEIQRKAAIHDALCEKYNVESLTDFVAWQRNHIAELEAAPPAPVGEGETAVMPDYPGYVMTQRECYQAGKKAGLAEAGNSPVIPDGYCIMPLKLTADNGAKGALCGEFHVQYRIVCQSCVGEGCEDCNHTGGWDAEIPVGWDTIKRIHEAAVEACAMPAAPQQEVKP
ncbi:hypothetical protein [Enterobacter quasimori]|uniref:hypothetical protein n=1 Tax=Enterobacter quasimori TaxID=2838947 RepID=UPI001FCFCFBA|nr:hypothetical protein [Enterobacter quasimori]